MKITHKYEVSELIKDVGDTIIVLNTDIQQVKMSARELIFSDNIEDDIKKNPELEVFWENLSAYVKWLHADAELKMEEFIAYGKKYLKWYLKGKGEKDTIEARNEAFYVVFGRNVDEKERKLAGIFAFRGFCEEKRQPLSHDEWLNLLQFVEGQPLIGLRDFSEFYEKMFKARSSGIYYDDLVASVNELKEAVETITAIADGFKQKGILLASLITKKKSIFYEREKILEEVIKKDKIEGINE